MEPITYPLLGIIASKNSKKYQKYFITAFVIDLLLIISGATLAIYNYNANETKKVIYIISAILLLSSSIISILFKIKKWENQWYEQRALTESIKTLTWRYAMKSKNYEYDDNVASTFKNDILGLSESYDKTSAQNNIFSKKLDELRMLPFEDRLKYYKHYRLEDQLKWYKNKASINKKSYTIISYIVVFCQILATLAIVYLIINPNSNWNFVGLITTLSGCFISWTQIKRFNELFSAYNNTAKEIKLILDEISNVDSENEFSLYVLNSETSISREHTMWKARRHF